MVSKVARHRLDLHRSVGAASSALPVPHSVFRLGPRSADSVTGPSLGTVSALHLLSPGAGSGGGRAAASCPSSRDQTGPGTHRERLCCSRTAQGCGQTGLTRSLPESGPPPSCHRRQLDWLCFKTIGQLLERTADRTAAEEMARRMGCLSSETGRAV